MYIVDIKGPSQNIDFKLKLNMSTIILFNTEQSFVKRNGPEFTVKNTLITMMTYNL